MNIKDLQPGSYKVVNSTQPTNIRDLSQGNYSPVTQPQTTPTSEYKPFRFNLPALTQQEKISKYKGEADKAMEESRKANSFTGYLKNAAPGLESLPFVGGAVALGNRTINKLIDNPTQRDSAAITRLSADNIQLLQRIRKEKAEGKETTRLERMYNSNQDMIDENMKSLREFTDTLPTTGQALGQLGHLALDIGTAGTYGVATKAMQAGRLAPGAIKTGLAAGTSNILKKKTGLFTAKGALNVAKGAFKGGSVGYGYDVAYGLEGKRGEEREGSKALIPGQMTAVGGAIGGGIAAIKGLSNSFKNARAYYQEKAAERANDLASKISQGKLADIPKVKRGIHQIDVDGIETYKDLEVRLNDKIDEVADGLDKTLDTNKTLTKLNALNIEETVGNKTVSHNYAKDAIAKLKELYTKVNDPVSLEKVVQLEKKASKQGLTIKEINNLAKDFGSEFGSKAFSKAGEPLTSVNAQALENIRSGVKSTGRGLYNNPVYAEADRNMADLIRTRDLVTKVAEQVNKMEQKTVSEGLGEKTGRIIMKIIDLSTGHSIKGAVSSIVPQGGTIRSLDAMALEKDLSRNLNTLNKVLDKIDDGTPEPVLQRYLLNTVDFLKRSYRDQGGHIAVPGSAYQPAKNAERSVNLLDPSYGNTTGMSANEILATKIDNSKALNAIERFDDSVERIGEMGGGWIEGMKEMFDTALNHKDALAVKALIKAKAVPEAYQKTFAKEIQKVLRGQ